MPTGNDCPCCQPPWDFVGGTRPPGLVLFWQKPGDSFLSGAFTHLISTLEDNGKPVHRYTDWTEDITDYFLILFPFPIAEPSWWDDLQNCRVHLMGENNSTPSFTPVHDFINSQSSLTGMTLVPDQIDNGCGNPGTVEAVDLTAGVTDIMLAGTSAISGGTVISYSNPVGTDPGTPWISRNKVDGIDWVVSGDTNHVQNTCGYATIDLGGENVPFILNLANVDI